MVPLSSKDRIPGGSFKRFQLIHWCHLPCCLTRSSDDLPAEHLLGLAATLEPAKPSAGRSALDPHEGARVGDQCAAGAAVAEVAVDQELVHTRRQPRKPETHPHPVRMPSKIEHTHKQIRSAPWRARQDRVAERARTTRMRRVAGLAQSAFSADSRPMTGERDDLDV